jgi:hypothetical protein
MKPDRSGTLNLREKAMKKNRGIAILLFAILLQMCSSGMELPALAAGAVGLVLAIIDDRKAA